MRASSVLGIVCGVPAGPIMSLPARVLGPETRAVGMGIYFTVYYVGMFVAPAAAGWLAARLGGASAAFDFGAAAVSVCSAPCLGFPHACSPHIRAFRSHLASGGDPGSGAAKP